MKPLPESLRNDEEQKWNEFCATLRDSNRQIPFDPQFNDVLKRIFVFSEFIFQSFIRNPNIAEDLILSGDLSRIYTPEIFISKVNRAIGDEIDEGKIAALLRKCRQREMIRIAFRDLAEWSDLFETMTDLSMFADTCLEQALTLLYKNQCRIFGIPVDSDGTPQQLVILALGKLGAYELNFSSDIDLMFAYPETGETQGGQKIITNDEFFVKLCRKLLNLLGSSTPDGIVFRIDMRLRPYGESGPIVMNFDSMVQYYQEQGREWERYMLIKARTAAGDKIAGARLLERLKPFVYRKYLDYGAFESLRDMKHRVVMEVQKKGMEDNIKLGPGGIREIEFFAQIFQLIRGGIVPELQNQRILQILPLLVKNYVPVETCKELKQAYIFFRRLENRLQEFSDTQTHELPHEPKLRSILAASMGQDSWESFIDHHHRFRQRVHHHFNNLLESTDSEERDETLEKNMEMVWQQLVDDDQSRNILLAAGYKSPDRVMELLRDLKNDLKRHRLSAEGRSRIEKLIPQILKKTGKAENPLDAFDHLIELIRSIDRRTSYISLLLEYPDVLNHLIRLVSASPWIARTLTRHPLLLDELLDSRTLYYPPLRQELELEIRQRLRHVPPGDLEAQMDELRIFKQINTLRVAAADLTNAIPLMKVSDRLSDIAETILNEVIERSWLYLVSKHGEPECHLNDKACDRGFAVIAYGKLGGLELSYGSDLDLVFLHAGTQEQTQGGSRPIDSPQFYARLGQRVLHMLMTHTQNGMLYDADMRLRPSGNSGALVSHIDAFRDYQLENAWTWEKQALIRARPISGNPEIQSRFSEIRRDILAQPRNPSELQEEVSSMRRKMRNAHPKTQDGYVDLKQDAGGLVDIEFLVQYLILLNAHRYPQIVTWTDNVRLLRSLLDVGVIDDHMAYFLRKAYLTYRSVMHRRNLQEKDPIVPESQFRELRGKVMELWKEFIKD